MLGRRRWTHILALLLALPLAYHFLIGRATSHPGAERFERQELRAIRDIPAPQYPGASAQHMHGLIGRRADGQPAWEPTPMPDHVETLEEKREHHKQNCFNLRRSDSLPLDRQLTDVRSPACKLKQYPLDLPQTSVVFVFFNEPLSPLFRSIHSVLDRTPPHLLKEIVLVDDGSDAPWLQQPLDDYLKLLPAKIKLRRMPERQGLMATRTEGARIASAETVTFLDSHIEVNEGWLEPLMNRIKQDRKHVVMPVIDRLEHILPPGAHTTCESCRAQLAEM